MSSACRELVGPFDQQAAAEAAGQLLVTVQSLVGVLETLAQDREAVSQDWLGPLRGSFDRELDRLLVSGALLTETLQRMATVVKAKALEAEAAARAEVAG